MGRFILVILMIFFVFAAIYDFGRSSNLMAIIEILIASVLSVGFSISNLHETLKKLLKDKENDRRTVSNT